ncbi:hypothetical protein ACFTSF_25515 [Kribbella sp. NPDC056951]|uniref:hypothetical protein n=1 Tax=Kribbella sp. NPDC056951 TaxID=3345978 RepID=UPI003639CDE2
MDNNPFNYTDPTGLSSTPTIGHCDLVCIFLAAAALAAATACIYFGVCGGLLAVAGRRAAATVLGLTLARAAAIAVAAAATAILYATASGDAGGSQSDDSPPSEDTIHSAIRGGERNIDPKEVMRNAERMYYDENGTRYSAGLSEMG